MTGPSPDVRATFEADTDPAVQALINLGNEFRNVAKRQDELEKGGRRTKETYGSVARVLGDVAAALGVAKLADFTRHQVEAADQLGKLSQKTGVAVETLSVLGFVGQKTGLDLRDLETDFSRLSRSLTDLQRGSPETVRAFRQIGLSAQDLAKLSPDEALLKIADAQARYASGTQKLDAIQQIFGRNASQLLPILNDLANGGFERARDRAEKLGIVLSGETAEAAAKFNDEVTELKTQAGALALTFANEVLPALTSTVQVISDAVANLSPHAKTVLVDLTGFSAALLGIAAAGRLAYPALKSLFLLIRANPEIAAGLLALGLIAKRLADIKRNADEAKASYDDFLGGLKTQQAVTDEINTLLGDRGVLDERIAAKQKQIDDFGPAGDNADRHAIRLMKKDLADLQQQRQVLTDRLQAAFKRSADIFNANLPKAPPPNVPDPAALAARADAEAKAAQDELKIAEAGQKAVAAANEDFYARGLKSLGDYYRERRALAAEATRGDIAALEAQKAALQRKPLENPTDQAERIKRQQEIASIEAQILAKRIEGRTDGARLDAEEREKALALATDRLQYEQKIQEAKGRTRDVAIAAIENEAAEFDKLLRQQGVAEEERQRKVNEFRQSQTVRLDFETGNAEAQREFQAIARIRDDLQNQVATGLLTEREAEEHLADVEASRLPTLRALAQQAIQIAEAMGDPEAIAQARDLAQQVENLAASADVAAQRTAELLHNLQQGIASGLSNFLTTVITDLDKVGDAVIDLIQSVAQAITQRIGDDIAEAIFRGARSGADAAVDAVSTTKTVVGAAAIEHAGDRLDHAGDKVIGAGGTILVASARLERAADRLLAAAVALAAAPTGGGGGGNSFGDLAAFAATASQFAFAEGGVVPGSGSGDTVPAMLTPGEGVLRVDEMRRLGGAAGFAKLRAMIGVIGYEAPTIVHSGVQHLASGGIVRSAPQGAGETSLKGHIAVSLDDGLAARLLDTDEAGAAIIRLVARHRPDVLAALEMA